MTNNNKGTPLYVVAYSDFAARKTYKEDDGRMARCAEDCYLGQLERRVADVLDEKYKDNPCPDDTLPEVRIGVIDEEYYDWLWLSPDTSEKRLEYVQRLTEQDATRLMQKHHKDLQVNMYVFPVLTYGERYVPGGIGKTAVMDEKQVQKLTKYFQKNFPDMIVYVPGCVLDPNDIDEIKDEFYNSCVNAIMTGRRAEVSQFAAQIHCDFEHAWYQYYVPVFIGYTQKSAWVDTNIMFDDDKTRQPESYVFDDISTLGQAPNRPRAKVSFDKGRVSKIIAPCFEDVSTADALPYLLFADDIHSNMDRFYRQLLGKLNRR